MPKYTPFTYKCTECNKLQKHYSWDDKALLTKKHKCDCGKTLGYSNIHKEEKVSLVGIKTPTKNRF